MIARFPTSCFLTILIESYWMTSYVIVCDKRDSAYEVLFMVDRNKQKLSFWSDRLDDVMKFVEYRAAVAQVRKLKFNNPRVVTLSEAHGLYMKHNAERIRYEQNERDHEYAMEACEAGWDGHKSW